MNFDVQLRATKYLKRVEHHTSVLLQRQHGQFTQSLNDYLESVLSDPFESEWRSSLDVFAAHWSERGLRISSRTMSAIRRLIEEELDTLLNADSDEGIDPTDAQNGILLAAAPGRRGQTSNHPGPAKAPTRTPSTGRYPKGDWIKGSEGNGLLKLAKPVKISATGEVVTEIPFKDGSPIFDKWAKSGPDIFIAMTGDNWFDQAETKNAWRAQHPGEVIETGFRFHHDGQVVELGTFRGKTIFAGRMQLVPQELNALTHAGSAQLARQFLLDKEIAREVNALARSGEGPLAKKLGKSLAKRAKQVARFVPIIGGAVTLIFFAEDVEAHGVAGAVLRATPMLGDIVAAHDLGTELASEIKRSAENQFRNALADANEPVRRAHAMAEAATAAAFNDIAKQVPVSRDYFSDEAIVDAIGDPLAEFYSEAYSVYFKHFQNPGTSSASSPASAEPRLQRAKEKLRRQLDGQFRPPAPPTSQRFI